MLSNLPSLLHSAGRRTLRAAFALGLVGLAAVSSARASTVGIEPSTVVPNDTFSLRVVGYNTNAPTSNILLTFPSDFTFGTSASYAGFALGGQALTVSSTEYTNSGTVYDLFTFSVPSNFVPAGTKDNAGNTLNAIQFSIGNLNGGTNPLNLSPAISSYTVGGTVIFNNPTPFTTGSVPMTGSLAGNGTQFSAFGSVFATPLSADISSSQITQFGITLTYAVPEPSTNAAIALGAAGMLLVVVRRRRSARI